MDEPMQPKMSINKHRHNISRNKKHKILHKQGRLKRKSIQNLFQKLKNQSAARFANDSIVYCDDDVPTKTTINNKSKKNSIIVIDDEPDVTITKESEIQNNKPNSSVLTTSKDTKDTVTNPVSSQNSTPNNANKIEDKPTVNTPTIVLSSTPNKDNSKTEIDKYFNISVVSAATNFNNNLDIINLNNDATKEINEGSYLTIDLTNESTSFANADNTVIDVDNIDNSECSFVSANSSMSGDSEVTVIKVSKKKKNIKNDSKMRKYAEGIAKLNATEKGRLLSLITENIFNGCNVMEKKKQEPVIDVEKYTRAPETVEDTYIKEIILGQRNSRNSVGSNIYNPVRNTDKRTGLRMIVIDGSNVAMEHGNGRIFSVRGLQICIDFFLKRGHTVKAFVPRFRCKFGKSSLPKLLDALERRGLVVFTPSREVRGRHITSYDDRYIIQCAAEFEGVIVSGDNYRDLLVENPRWRQVIETRLLQFTWVNDMIMFPKDPLGRDGPSLEEFLRH